MIQDSFTTFSFNMKYQEDVFKILLKIKWINDSLPFYPKYSIVHKKILSMENKYIQTMHRKWQQQNIKTIEKNSENTKWEKADGFNSFWHKAYDYGQTRLNCLTCNAIYIMSPEKTFIFTLFDSILTL